MKKLQTIARKFLVTGIVAGTTAACAVAGAIIGSVIPGAGTIAGLALGGAIGVAVGGIVAVSVDKGAKKNQASQASACCCMGFFAHPSSETSETAESDEDSSFEDTESLALSN